MTNISIRVELQNDSDATLSLVEHRLRRNGECKDGKAPPRSIGPRSVSRWHAIASSPLVGIEGHATYNMSLQQAHLREVGDWVEGAVPADVAGHRRPMAVRDWMRAMGP